MNSVKIKSAGVKKDGLSANEFDGKKEVVFKFAADGVGQAVVTRGERRGFPDCFVISCLSRSNLGSPDSGGGVIVEFPPSGLLIKVRFDKPLIINQLPDNAVLTFSVARMGITEISHWSI